MIVHARVAKLYQYLHDPDFDRVMSHIGGALEEGLKNFELEVDRLDNTMRLDLLEAFDAMGYTVVYDNNAQIFEVSID